MRRNTRLVKDLLASLIDNDEWWDKFFGRYATEQVRTIVLNCFAHHSFGTTCARSERDTLG